MTAASSVPRNTSERVSNGLKLLITTQAVDLDDPVLGFFHRWVEEFAAHVDSIEVICLRKGRYALPANVHVHSLGKECGAGKLARAARFLALIWKLRRSYDAVFVHMNPEYVVLGGALWRMSGKPVVLWYTHRQVNIHQRIALLFSTAVVTAASESFRIPSKKVSVVGHGIDTERFSNVPLRVPDHAAPRLLAVGRITPIKNLDIAVGALALLRRGGVEATLTLVGGAVTESDVQYEEKLHSLAAQLGVGNAVIYRGFILNSALPAVYAEHDIALNLCPTGGIDKAVLEAMAAGLPTVVANTAFKHYFGVYAPRLLCAYRDEKNTAEKVRALLASGDFRTIQTILRELAREKADVAMVVSAILRRFP